MSAYTPLFHLQMTEESDSAGSQTMAIVFMVGITILLAALVILLFHIPAMGMISPSLPAFEIRSVDHFDEITGKLNYDSRLRFINNGTMNYKNDDLMAIFIKPAVHGVAQSRPSVAHSSFLPTSWGTVDGRVRLLGHPFTPGEQIVIDFSDATFRPGDIIRMDVLDRKSQSLISTHTYQVRT
jgi:hypothetical protein